MNGSNLSVAEGVVTVRKCPSCGADEIGFTTQDGQFHSLPVGARIRVLSEGPAGGAPDAQTGPIPPWGAWREEPGDEPSSAEAVWVPAPVRSDPRLRRLYGVMLPLEAAESGMTPALYREAYLEKLKRLIERETDLPIAAVLDQEFAAAHLASSDPGQTARNIWLELEEIRAPAERVTAFLESPDQGEVLGAFSGSRVADSGEAPDEERLRQEVAELSLMGFLELL